MVGGGGEGFSFECAKLRALLALVSYVLSCLACPRVLRALVPYVPSSLTCPRPLRGLVLCVPYVSCMLSCLTCIKVYLVGCS